MALILERRMLVEEPLRKEATLRKLFVSMLYISAFTFGGGFVIVTFMRKKFVDDLHWIDESEMLDLIALAQSCPGAMAINTSILLGWRMAGLPGVLVSVLGTTIPPVAIITVISFFYDAFSANPWVALALKGMQAGVAAVFLDVVWSMGSSLVKGKSLLNYAIMVIAFVATFVFDLNVIFIILGGILLGIFRALWQKRKGAAA